MQDQLLRKALSYRRFQGPARVLIFNSDYYVVPDVIQAARDLGYGVSTLSVKLTGKGEDRFIGDLLHTLVMQQPDFILTINHSGFDEQGVLSGLLCHYQIPFASWFVDHPLPILGPSPGNVVSFCQVFCIEHSALPSLVSLGFRDPVHLPTASSRHVFHPDRVDVERADRLGHSLCFVGDSWWRKGFAEPTEHLLEQAKKLREKYVLGKEFVKQLLWEAIGKGARDYAVAQVALAQTSAEQRAALATALTPLGLHIYGDPHWHTLARGLTVRPQVDPIRELPAVFAGSQVNVNITSAQLPTAVNQRVWDVPGACGFLLSDAQEDLLEMFREDEEVVVYRTMEEAADKARFYLDQPEKRRAIAKRGHEKIERLHRYTDRLRRITETMRARFA